MLTGHGINFVPMVRGAEMDKAVEEGLPRGKRALLGFNEPNFPEYFDWDSWSRRRVDGNSKLCLNAQVVGDWVVALQVFKNSMIILLSCGTCEADSCSTFLSDGFPVEGKTISLPAKQLPCGQVLKSWQGLKIQGVQSWCYVISNGTVEPVQLSFAF